MSARVGFSIDDEDLGDLKTVSATRSTTSCTDRVRGPRLRWRRSGAADAPQDAGAESTLVMVARGGGAVDPALDARLQLALGWTFVDHGLLDRALTHRSYCAEQGVEESNERLEFLGDSVLGLVVTRFTYEEYPQLPEGELAKFRASVVSAETLAEIAQELDLGVSLRLGKGEDASGGRAKPSILADAMEAVIAAVYLDGGSSPPPDSCSPCSSPGSANRRPAPAGRTTRRGCRSSQPGGATSCPATRYVTRAPITPSASSPRCSSATRSTAQGRALEEGGRAGGGTDRVGTVARRGEQRPARPGGPYRGGRCLSCRRSRSYDDLDREVVGKKIKAVDVDGMRSVRRHHNRKQFAQRLRQPQDHRRRAQGQVPPGAPRR